MVLGLDIGVTRRSALLKSGWTFLFNILCTVFMEYGFANFVINSITDIDAITSSLSMFNQGILLTFKVLVMVFKGDEMLKLIWDMNRLARGGKFGGLGREKFKILLFRFSANAKEWEIWISENRMGKWIALGYYYCCYIAATIMAVMPWLFMLYEYVQGRGVHLRLPFQLQ